MKKTLYLLLTIVLLILVSCSKKDESLKNTLLSSFKKTGVSAEIKEFQPGRSESFQYTATPSLLLIDGEESFLFEYPNKKEVKTDLSQTLDTDKGYVYSIDRFIILYRGENQEVHKILKDMSK